MADTLPTVVIVGRPNVGKSTLFNRLVGQRLAVVEDTPGVTRDRLYADAVVRNKRCRVVDTGGILFGDEDPLVEQIKVQAEVALAEADVVLFVVDGGDGLNPADEDLADRLRGFPKPVLLVVNKVDTDSRSPQAQEFWSLGIGEELYEVSAIHNHGFYDLTARLAELLPQAPAAGDFVQETRLAIVGRPNVGKSSLLNAFTGERRAIVSDIPGTTRDAIDTLVEFKGQRYRLIDTAGIRRRGKIQGSIEYYMVLRAIRAVQRADCALVVLDGMEGLTDGDKRVAKEAHDMGKAIVFAANKWDLREPPAGDLGKRSLIKKDFERAVRGDIPELDYVPIRFASALAESGMEGVINAVNTAVRNWDSRVATGPLNRLVQDVVFEKPLVRRGKALKVRYVTQAETRPPTFVLFVNDPDLMHFSYVRYIENQIREKFALEGTPVRMVVRAGHSSDDDED